MRNTIILAAALVASAAAQPTVEVKTLWLDTVKRGEMTRQVRGLGEIAGAHRATIRIAETQIADVRKGQPVAMESSGRAFSGVVEAIGSSARNGVIDVQVTLQALPAGLAVGAEFDAAIHIEKLPDVVMVGRPVMARPQSEDSVYKLDADGRHATLVQVRYGRTSVNTVEVVKGLQPGDRIILSDMSSFGRAERIALR